jgi:hypothetical protein
VAIVTYHVPIGVNSAKICITRLEQTAADPSVLNGQITASEEDEGWCRWCRSPCCGATEPGVAFHYSTQEAHTSRTVWVEIGTAVRLSSQDFPEEMARKITSCFSSHAPQRRTSRS